MEKSSNIIKVLMFPLLAYGHISPFLELAKRLVNSKKFIVYLCSTPINLASIKNKLKGDAFSSSINLVELHLQESSDLPSSYHTTNGLPANLMGNLKQVLHDSLPNFPASLKDLKPDLLVYDVIQPWAADIAKENHIPAIYFIISSSAMTSLVSHAFKNPQGKTKVFPFIETIRFRSFEKHYLDNLIAGAENQCIEKESSIDCIEKSDIVLIKGIRDIEGKYCDYLSKLWMKSVLLLGPLVEAPDQDDGEDSEIIISWLDKKRKKSTVFVSFGSEYFLKDEEMEEIAYGLEQSKVNFVWVVRFPKGEDVELEKVLPEGFLTKVGERGLVVEAWAPQMKILEHSSIGGFVSYCGWNSIMETMKYGVPIIALPMQFDQPINSRLVEEVGVGIEVLRSEDMKFQKEKIAEVIDRVVVDEEGKLVRDKAKEISKVIELRGDEEMDRVVAELVKLCNKKTSKIV